MAMPTAASREAPWKPTLLLQQAGEQRAEQGAEVDAEVEQREAGVAALVVLGVERADQRGGVRLQAAAADGDQHQADADAESPGSSASAMCPAMITTAL